MVQPTEEQQAAVDKFLTGRTLKITAFAGAGKTTILRMLAEASRGRGGRGRGPGYVSAIGQLPDNARDRVQVHEAALSLGG
jgi:ABC-type transport system involved in cytochrome c biogenesis ATPase subunit